MSVGRTYWWAKDSAWWRRERIVKLGLEFGSAGPAIIDWLSCEAKAQGVSGVAGGQVKSGVASVAHGAFVDVEVVHRVLSRSVTLGLLDDYREDDGLFECRISGWRKDQERGRAAQRKADERDRRKGETPEFIEDPDPDTAGTGHAESRPVTVGHAEAPTGQDRSTEEGDAPANGVHPHLGEVVGILTAAPGLVIEEMAINSALMARQDRDALELAQIVASWAHEGGMHISSANRLLFAAAERVDRREAGKDGARAAAAERIGGRERRSDERDERAAADLAAIDGLIGGASAVA